MDGNGINMDDDGINMDGDCVNMDDDGMTKYSTMVCCYPLRKS